MKPIIQRVGRLTVAIGLVLFGVALLIDNFRGGQDYLTWVIKLWPALLIGFGVEYLVRSLIVQRQPEGTNQVALRFDFGGAFLLLLVGLLSAGIFTFRHWIVNEPGRITFIGGPSVSATDSAAVKVGNAKELQVDVSVGSVRLEQASNPAEVRVEATYTAYGLAIDTERVRADLGSIKLKITEGDVITVGTDTPNRLDNVSIKYVVYAPPGLKVKTDARAGSIQVTDYRGDMVLTTGAGRVDVEAGTGSVDARSSAGSITVRNFNGPVSARASIGQIEVDNVVGSLQLDSGTGSINVREFAGGKLVAETRTGGISVNSSAMLDGDVVLKTSAGSVSLVLPRESSMRASAQTRAGSMSLPPFMSVTGNGPSKSGVGTSGDGKYTVTLEAGTGSVHFTTR